MKWWTVMASSMLVAITGGCGGQEKHYTLQGQVLAKDEAAGKITVKHEDIPGLMPAMTMPYRVKDPFGMKEVQPGDAIVADLIAANGGKDYWLQSIRITDESGRKTAKPHIRHALKIGDPAPEVPFTNQDGKQLHFSDFKGKSVLITFIYTRCPMPEFCPRLSSQFAKIHEDLVQTPADYDKTHLLTLSFDSKYDTAPVLRKYGLAYLDDHPEGFSHWDFASADPADMRQIADAFGLDYFEEDNQISHSMDIVLLTPEGKIAQYWSNEWTTAELESSLRQQAKSSIGHRGPKG
ncbi:MAG TPA: SCO family protein [Bryobacteraceae bacterium]|nr:SCO family protein [Bryobacteraceae bacterium]